MEKIVETHNLFIDTSTANKESNSRGDDFQLHLNTQSVDADRNQFIRLTLNDFSMYKTWTDVNDNNRAIIIDDGTGDRKLALTKQNYETLYDLALNFANLIGTDIITNTAAASFTVTGLTPGATTGINGTADNIIRFTINTNIAHGLTQYLIQLFEEEGDAWALLGGNRIYGTTPSTENSLKVTIATTAITFECLYPAQRSTTSHIYLRTSLTTGSSETASLAQETDIDIAPEVSYSNILARIPVNTEFCTYTSNTGREYYLDLHQKHLNNIKLSLTDQHSRRIGRRPASFSSKTAAGRRPMRRLC